MRLALALALARVAAGGTRRGLMVERSGAERADCPAVLAAGAHRTTHYAPCGLFVQTGAMRMITKRAARAAPAAVLLGAPQIAPAGSRLPRRWVFGVRCFGIRLSEDQEPGGKGVWGPVAARLLGRRGAHGLRPARSAFVLKLNATVLAQ